MDFKLGWNSSTCPQSSSLKRNPQIVSLYKLYFVVNCSRSWWIDNKKNVFSSLSPHFFLSTKTDTKWISLQTMRFFQLQEATKAHVLTLFRWANIEKTKWDEFSSTRRSTTRIGICCNVFFFFSICNDKKTLHGLPRKGFWSLNSDVTTAWRIRRAQAF